MILFLDFDGVLHPDPCPDKGRLFENAQRLADTLAQFPEVAIVLSTSWRNVRPENELLEPLPATLRVRVLGITPRFGEFTAAASRIPYRRHAECEQWLISNDMADSPWWALDDRAYWFAPYCENLIQCDAQRGFDERARAHLTSTLTLARKRIASGVDLILT
ncbi:MAG TPA: HAD domain-containing protein [Burkholderiaceae bacterium]|nr:HAD domain-containing protein [Burkholderiaceae bacterium]